jgi:hypothetical protein
MTLCTLEEGHGLPEAVDRLLIVTLPPVCCTKVELRQSTYDGIPGSGSQHQGTLGGGNRLVIRPHVAEMSR